MGWDIKRCNGRCIKCNKEFADGESYLCRLLMQIDGPYREDYCESCWNEGGSSFDKGFSCWQGRFIKEPEEEKEEMQEPVLKRLLKKWLHSKERLHQCFCYVLAVLLERKKTFKACPRTKDSDGIENLVYEDKDTGETYVLPDPLLTLKELGEIEEQLHAMIIEEFDGNKSQKSEKD